MLHLLHPTNSPRQRIRRCVRDFMQQIFIRVVKRLVLPFNHHHGVFFVTPRAVVMDGDGDAELDGFKIILDKTSIEIFYNNGEIVMTEIFFLTEPFTHFSASSNQEIEISNLKVQQLKLNQ